MHNEHTGERRFRSAHPDGRPSVRDSIGLSADALIDAMVGAVPSVNDSGNDGFGLRGDLRIALAVTRRRTWNAASRMALGSADPSQSIDRAVCDWWVERSPLRDAAWGAASIGDPIGPAFVGCLVDQLLDTGHRAASKLLLRDLDLMLSSLDPAAPSPFAVGLRSWRSALDVSPAAAALAEGVRSQRLTRAWLAHRRIDLDHLDDAVLSAGVTGSSMVVEFDDHFDRHVIEPIHLAQDDDLSSDALCIDHTTGTTGWLCLRLGLWTPESVEN